MPFPDRLARFNRWITNPVLGTFSGRLPPFAIVEHTGRRSGRAYRTPVWAFRVDDGFVIALTYGAERDWVKNVHIQGGCTFIRGGRRIALAEPRVVGETEGRQRMPALLRPVLRLLGVTQYLRLRPAERPAEAIARPGG